MADEGLRPIIVKRIKKMAAGHHGGAWKVAYADFVTAMMAFFLLMWLLGSTTKGDLNGISEYFKTPLKVALMGGSGSGDSPVIKGGGKDLTRPTARSRRANAGAEEDHQPQGGQGGAQREEDIRLQALKAKIEATIEAIPC